MLERTRAGVHDRLDSGQRAESVPASGATPAELAALAFVVAPLPAALLDAEGRVSVANRAFAEMTGRDEEGLVGVPMSALVVAGHRLLVRSALSTARRHRSCPEPPVVRLAPDSTDRWAQLHVAALPVGPPENPPAPAGGPEERDPVSPATDRPSLGRAPREGSAGYVAQLVDVTAQRLHERRLRDLAFRDPLTQVLSRRGIQRAIATFSERLERDGQPGSLLAIDLDRFKDVNDTLGHPVGDAVLARVATEIRRRLRPKDLVGRLGGDEFIVLLPSCRVADAERVADDLLEAIAGGLDQAGSDTSGPAAEDSAGKVTASVGIAAFEPGLSSDDVIAAADRGLYAAKRRGGNCWSHDPGPEGQAPRPGAGVPARSGPLASPGRGH